MPWFGDEFVDIGLVDCVQCNVEVSVGCEQDAHGVGANVLRDFKEFYTIHFGHAII